MMRIATALYLVVAFSLTATAQTVLPASIVVAEGDSVDVPGGQRGLITNVNDPMTDGASNAGFTGTVSIGGVSKGYVWWGDKVIWFSDMGLPTVLGIGEAYMGIGNDSTFIYSPPIDATAGGGDGVWTDQGELLHDNDPAPGIAGMFITFCSRPNMTPSGTAYWMSGITNVVGGTTQAEVIYKSSDRTPGAIEIVFQEGGLIGGIPTDDLSFDYDMSENGAHFAMQPFLNTGATTDDAAITLDSVIVAREGSPTGDGDNWVNFNLVRVNNDGTIAFTGDTDAAANDAFIAVDGVIAVREGDTFGTVTLGTTDRGLALRNDGFMAWAWTTSVGVGDEVLFLGQASNLAASSVLVLRTGDGLDVTGDLVADYLVADFESLSSDGQGSFDWTGGTTLYTMLELTPVGGGTNIIANVGLDLSAFLPTAGAPGPAPDAASLAVSPNPFGDAAQISITLAEAQSAVTVEVLDVLGRRVALIHDGPMAAGTASLAIDARLMEAGVYVVRATAGDWSQTSRVTRF
jgi:hypothetical protein